MVFILFLASQFTAGAVVLVLALIMIAVSYVLNKRHVSTVSLLSPTSTSGSSLALVDPRDGDHSSTTPPPPTSVKARSPPDRPPLPRPQSQALTELGHSYRQPPTPKLRGTPLTVETNPLPIADDTRTREATVYTE